MSYSNFNKKVEIKEIEKNKDLERTEKERKYSKKALKYGLIGMGAVGLVSLFSNNIDFEYLSKEVQDLNRYEMINSILLGLSSITTLAGGAMYGISYLFENDFNLEKNTTKNNLEKDLKD